MIPQGAFSPFHQQRWVEAYNDGAATIPSRGICEITDSYRPDSASAETPNGGRTVLKVRQPTTSYVLKFAINGPLAIAAGKTGFVTTHYPAWVAYNAAYTPATDEEWGITSGSCLVTRYRSGLIILGDAIASGASGFVRVDKTQTTELIGKGPAGGIAKGSSGTCAVWMRNVATGDWEDSGYTLSAKALGAAIPSGTKYVSMGYRCGQWLVSCWES